MIKNPHGGCSSSAAITDSFVGVGPAQLTPSTIAFFSWSPIWRLCCHIILKGGGRGAQCPAALRALVLPRGDPRGSVTYSSTVSHGFFSHYSWQRAIFIPLNYDLQERRENTRSFTKAGAVCHHIVWITSSTCAETVPQSIKSKTNCVCSLCTDTFLRRPTVAGLWLTSYLLISAGHSRCGSLFPWPESPKHWPAPFLRLHSTIWYELHAREWPYKSQPAEVIIWQIGSGMKPNLSQTGMGKEISVSCHDPLHFAQTCLFYVEK